MSRTWEQLVQAGSRALGVCERAVTAFQWELGDLDCEVEAEYGADSVQRYAAEVGVEYEALLSYGSVAKAYPRHQRSPSLPWSGHQALAGQADKQEQAPVRASNVLDALPDATAVLDTSGTIVSVNHTWRMFAVDNGGQPARTGIGVNYFNVCASAAANGCHDAHVAAVQLRAVLAGSTIQSELQYPCPSPAVNRWFLLRHTRLVGETPGAVMSHVNITRRVMAEQALAHQAAHDPLTSLANRRLFTAHLNAALTPRPGRPGGAQVGVLFLDVDKFKQINDTYGHDAGDEVLLTIAHRLRSAVRPDHTVARLGGDEFAIIAPRIGAEGMDALAGRLQSVLSPPHLIHGRTVQAVVSIGVHHAAVGELADEAVRRADQAMYTAKRRNRRASAQT